MIVFYFKFLYFISILFLTWEMKKSYEYEFIKAELDTVVEGILGRK